MTSKHDEVFHALFVSIFRQSPAFWESSIQDPEVKEDYFLVYLSSFGTWKSEFVEQKWFRMVCPNDNDNETSYFNATLKLPNQRRI